MPSGTVTQFDERRGLGTIRSDDAEYGFHTTQIVDGSRSIRVGQTVEFDIVPGRLGNWEAAHAATTSQPARERSPWLAELQRQSPPATN